MFRKMILAGIVAFGLLGGVAAVSTVQAQEPIHHRHERFEVLYRRHHHHHWHVYGCFHHRWEAEHAARRLYREGYHTAIEER